MTAKHLFVGCDGHLHDTRDANWASVALRERYRFTFGNIGNVSQLKATLRNGAYAWPGGYPLFFITSDGAPLCFDCARSEFRSVAESIRDELSDGWRIVACDINYEDDSCFCDHCNEKIESAYGN